MYDEYKSPFTLYHEARKSPDHASARKLLDELDAAGLLAEDPDSENPSVLKERYVMLGMLCNATQGPEWLQEWGRTRAVVTLRRFLASYPYPHTSLTVYRWLTGSLSWIRHESDEIYAEAVAGM